MIAFIFILGLGMTLSGWLLIQWFIMPLLGLTLDVIISSTPFLNIIVAALSCVVAPYLIINGLVICVTIAWFSLTEGGF